MKFGQMVQILKMKKHKKTHTLYIKSIIMITCNIIVTSSFINVQNAYAGVATEYTQYLNFGKLSLQYAKQIQQYATQLQQLNYEINQYMNMVKNTINLPNEIFNKFAGKIAQVAQIYRNSTGIVSTLMHADEELKRIYQNYEFYRMKNMGVKDYFLQYRDWNSSNSKMYERMMQMLGTQASSLENEQDIIKELINANKGDIGNELTGMLVQQMQELRKLIMGQNELATKVQAQAEAEKANQLAVQERLNKWIEPTIGNGRVY
jgi:P-type conjugative transfer protein TrbJ